MANNSVDVREGDVPLDHVKRRVAQDPLAD